MTAAERRAIQLEDFPDFQRRSWRFRRLAWLLMALVLGAGAAGVFGRGPLARTALPVAPGMTLEYERWARARAPLVLRLRVDSVRGDTLRLHLGWPLLDRVEILSIEPSPAVATADAAGIEYRFPFDAAGAVAVRLEPERAGRLEATLRAGDAPATRLPLFIWP